MGIKKFVVGAFETNTYIITKQDRAIVIDPGLGFEEILNELQGYTVEAILITHGHIDHIDGCGYLNVPIYVGKEDLDNFKDLTKSLYHMTYSKPRYDLTKLNLIGVSDSQVIELPSFSFKAFHTPGHTAGSMCYLYFNNLFSGDTLFKSSIGRTDFPSGSFKAMNESLKYLKKVIKDDVVIYPGHEDKTTMRQEKQNNPYLK